MKGNAVPAFRVNIINLFQRFCHFLTEDFRSSVVLRLIKCSLHAAVENTLQHGGGDGFLQSLTERRPVFLGGNFHNKQNAVVLFLAADFPIVEQIVCVFTQIGISGFVYRYNNNLRAGQGI